MFGYSMSASSSSGTSNLPPGLSMSSSITGNGILYNGVQMNVDEIKALKASWKALPAGMVIRDESDIGKSNSQLKRDKRGKSKGKRNVIVSKAFNPSGVIPLRKVKNLQQIFYANLRLENASVLVTSVAIPSYAANQFSLNDFSNASEYTGLFDQYKIEQFEVWIQPLNSASTVNANTGYFASAVDLDDANAPTSVVQVEGKQNAISTNGYDGHYHRWNPHIATAVYSGAFTSFANEEACWIDVASPSVQHYGLKYATSVTGSVITYRLSLRARVAFRQAGI